MAEAQKNDTVKVHYTGKLEDGTVFDSSEGGEPIEFTIGEHQVLPAFEEAVEGMEPGETKSETIQADNAYGPYREELRQEVARSQFPEDAEVTPGQRFRASANGQDIVFSVVNVEGDSVEVDANHPLAGKTLDFEITLVEIE